MPRTRNPYPSELRDQIVALLRVGAAQRIWRANSSSVPRQSTAGSSRPIVMAAAAMMGDQPGARRAQPGVEGYVGSLR